MFALSFDRVRYLLGAAALFLILISPDASAQYRAGVGCPGLRLDTMPPNMTAAQLECQCFNKCNAPTPPPPDTGGGSGSFDMCSNCWVKGDGYAKFPANGMDSCRRACRGDVRCLSFEFYVPESMCNLYQTRMRVEPDRGSAFVGIRN